MSSILIPTVVIKGNMTICVSQLYMALGQDKWRIQFYEVIVLEHIEIQQKKYSGAPINQEKSQLSNTAKLKANIML
jgi:hypothetical protein